MSSSKAPIFKADPKPENLTKKEEEYYYSKEKEKWEQGVGFEGYGIGIPGSLYHYLKEHQIKHRITSKGQSPVSPPICRETEFLVFHEIEQKIKQRRMLGVVKARNVGLSTIGGSLVNYFMRVFPGSTSLVTSRAQSTIGALFRDKIMVPFNSYDPAIRPDIIQKNETMDKNYLRVGIHYKDSLGRPIYDESVCECYETSERPKSPENFSGRGANYGFYDEFALHGRKRQLLASSIECYKDPVTRQNTGFLLWGGTVEYREDGTGIGNKELNDLQDLIADSALWDTDVLFIPYWMSMCDPVTGRVDRVAAEKWWNQEYQKVKHNEHATKAFLRNNPRTLDDIFQTIGSDRWDEYTGELIKAQRKDVIESKIPLQVCDIININGSTTFPQGKSCHILEHPKAGMEYLVTVDGVQTSDLTSATPHKDKSKICAVVTKLVDPSTLPYMPVLLFSEYPKSLEGSVYKIVDIIKYYDKLGGVLKINAEVNVGFGEFFGTILKNEGYSSKIARKKDFSQDGFRDTKKWFYYRDDKVRERQMAAAGMFLKKHISSIQILPLLDAMMKQADKNSDELDAWLGIFETLPNLGMTVKKKLRAPTQRMTTTITFDAKGRSTVSLVPARY